MKYARREPLDSIVIAWGKIYGENVSLRILYCPRVYSHRTASLDKGDVKKASEMIAQSIVQRRSIQIILVHMCAPTVRSDDSDRTIDKIIKQYSIISPSDILPVPTIRHHSNLALF